MQRTGTECALCVTINQTKDQKSEYAPATMTIRRYECVVQPRVASSRP